MDSKNKYSLLVGLILAVSFFVESPLSAQILSRFDYAIYLVTILIKYVAMLVCVLVLIKGNVGVANILKCLGVISAFAVIDVFFSTLLISITVTSVYQIIRPLLLIGTVILTVKWAIKFTIHIVKPMFYVGTSLFVINIALTILEYFRIIALMSSVGSNFFSTFGLMTSNNSTYSILSLFCNYILLYLVLLYARKCIGVCKMSQEKS